MTENEGASGQWSCVSVTGITILMGTFLEPVVRVETPCPSSGILSSWGRLTALDDCVPED